MAQRIKVTGFVDIEDVPANLLDLDHEMGLSSEGYETGIGGLAVKSMDDVEYELVDED